MADGLPRRFRITSKCSLNEAMGFELLGPVDEEAEEASDDVVVVSD